MIRRIFHYLFIDDYIAKLICLGIGTGLWFYVEFARVTQTTLNIPIEYIKKPVNLYLKQGQPRFAKIVVRGRDEFIKFSTAGIKAEVNLASAKTGETNYPLLFDARQLPERVELASKPETILVGLEKGAVKFVPVKPVFTGTPAAEWRVLRSVVNPPQIEIEGPEALVQGIATLDTEPIDIEGAKKALNVKINLRIPDGITTDKIKNATVRLDLAQKIFSEEARFEQIPLKVQNLDAALTATLSDSTVVLQVLGEKNAIDKLKGADFYAYVSAEDTRFNSRTGNILPYANESGVVVKARLVTGNKKIQIVSIAPDKINIRFAVKPEYQKREVSP